MAVANEVQKPAIIAASTTNDVIRAMVDDTTLRSAVLKAFSDLTTGDGKALLTSRSFWANLLTPLATWVIARYFTGLDPTTVTILVGAASAGMAAAMRMITKEPIVSVLPQGNTHA